MSQTKNTEETQTVGDIDTSRWISSKPCSTEFAPPRAGKPESRSVRAVNNDRRACSWKATVLVQWDFRQSEIEAMVRGNRSKISASK